MTGPASKTKTRRSGRAKEVGTQGKAGAPAPLGLVALELLKQWRSKPRNGVLFVADNESRAERLGMILHALDARASVLVFPRPDTLPFDASPPSSEIAGRRASVLRRLAEAPEPSLLVATPEALIQRVPPPPSWANASIRFRTGSAFDAEAVTRWLGEAGYDLEGEPDYPGNALMQAQVLEVFPGGALGPVRVQHAEGVVQGIESFDPVRRSAIAPMESLVLDPIAVDLRAHGEQLASLFDYVAGARLAGDPDVPTRADKWLRTIAELSAAEPGSAALFLAPSGWHAATERMQTIAAEPEHRMPNFALRSSVEKDLRAFLRACKADGTRVLLTAADAKDLRRMERLAGVATTRQAAWSEALAAKEAAPGSLLIDFEQGFMLTDDRRVAVVAAADVLGSRARHLEPMAKPKMDRLRAADLPKSGDTVVHVHRGRAVLGGLESLSADPSASTEMARLVFANDQAVLVPVPELALIWPYGAEAGAVSLDKADGSSWQKRVADAAKEVEATAAHILEAVRERTGRQAPRIRPPAAEYERFAARFPYVATADQATAIDDVLRDLGSGHPMDRVVCGDVGFGKTEVALRAAAAVAFSGMQVAIVAPTTVLARQHATTFRRRFAPFEIEPALLTGFTPAAERRAIKAGLKDGKLKIVVGTHALAADDVVFSKLGLVVVDEEQHFGAAQKRKLFALSDGVHRLAMSATPIPRTLAGAVTGLNDLSIIASAPAQRTGVVTTLAPLGDGTIAAALRREHRRHGQSFVVCPRIQDIEPMYERLRRIVPELKIAHLHGRLPAQEIDETMTAFVEGRADVLLATNIVENGLDIPRANTILICRPEQFGLGQLHQLRGRVGRGGTRAFATLLSDASGEKVQKRLAAMQELSRPGAGLELSQRDFELRGGGDLLSDQQSGHVSIFGPALYRWLLGLALEGKYRGLDTLTVPELHLGVPEELPVAFVSNEATRLEIYLRLAKATEGSEIDAIEDELESRFGALPDAAQALIAAAHLRRACRALGVTRLEAGPAGVAATLEAGRSAAVTAPLQRDGARVLLKMRIAADQRLAAARKLLALLGGKARAAQPRAASAAGSRRALAS